jgi:hypothetical protein
MNTSAPRLPQKDERYRCPECGMEILVTVECRCPNVEDVFFECCGEEMVRV